MPPHHASLAVVAGTAVVGALLLAPTAVAAPATIYKCVDRHVGLVYTDQPCKGGEPLDIHPGEADPGATARLARDREALDRGAAARIEELRRDVARTELAALTRQRREQDRAASVADPGPAYATDNGPWYPAFLPAHRWHSPRPNHRHSPRASAEHRDVPSAPFLVPRS